MARSVHLSYRAMLLASAAGLVWSGAAHATNYNNTSPASGTSTLYNLGSGDNLTNSSSVTITSGSQPAVQVVSSVSAGTITNSGTIASQGSPGGAIQIGGSAALSLLSNSGVIAADQDNGTAIQVNGSLGALINQASGTISANGANGVAVNVFGNVGSIGNSGLIRATGANGTAIATGTLGSIGTLSNSGTILASGTNAVAVAVAGTMGLLTNSGLIQDGAPTNNGPGAVFVASTGTLGQLSNNAGGTIGSSGYSALDVAGRVGAVTNGGFIGATGGNGNDSVFIESGGAVGSFTNLAGGTIQANTPDGWGIEVGGSVGTLSNLGLIQAINASGNPFGINVLSSGSIGLLTNAGTINASDTAIRVSGSISGGITNMASGLIQGGPANGSGVAIDNSGGAGPLTITNFGRVVGGIDLGPYADMLNVRGGSITGAITGTGSTDTLNFALGTGGSFTTGGSISGVSYINVTSGSVNFLNSVAGAQAFNVSSGATAMLNPGGPITATSFNNAGIVNVGGGAASVTGDYTQGYSGRLQVTVTNASGGGMQTGSLAVSGSAMFQGNTLVIGSVPYTTKISSLIGQSATVLTAGSLTGISSNSTAATDNVAVAFNLSEAGGTSLVLTARTPTDFNQAFAVALAEIDRWYAQADTVFLPTTNDIFARRFLAAVLAGLSLRGDADLVQFISRVLDPPSNLALAEFERQLQPNPLFGASVNVAMSAGTFGTGVSQIEQREQMTLLEDTGLSAGDTVGRGIAAWVQPFGSFLTQDAKNGADGYSVNTYGATMGADTRVTPQLRLGVALTLANQDLTMNGLSSGAKGSTFTAQFGLYGVWHWNDFFVDGLLSYGHNSYSNTVPIPLFGLTKKADYGGNQFGAKIGAGYNYTLPNRVVVTPYVSLQQVHFGVDSYTTTGAYPFNAHVSGQSADLTQSSLGVRVAYPIKLSMGTLRPEVHTNWFHTFGNTQITTTYSSSDVTGGGSFLFTGPSLDRDMFNIGFSATLLQNGPWSFGAGYDFNGRSSSTEHIVYLRASYKF